MPIIKVEPGEVYEFTTIGGTSTIISQFAGTSDVFNKDVYGQTIYTGSSANLIIDDDAKLRVDGTFTLNRAPIGINWYPVNTDTHGDGTSSLNSNAAYQFTGSFIGLFGTADHLILLGTPNIGALPDNSRPQIRLIRRDSNTGKITITASLATAGPFYFNGTETLSGSLSCSDPFCSIEINSADTLRWIVTSVTGNWTSP